MQLLALFRIRRHSPGAVTLAWLATAVSTLAAPVDFAATIRPIISGKCFACHGADESTRKAKLRLDVREEAIKPRGKKTAIVPGEPQASEVMRRVTTTDPDDLMPPPKSGHALTQEEVGALRRWIAEGANYAGHWAFEKPRRPAVPAAGSSTNAVDKFIQAKLAAAGFQPAPRADRHTLVRRVSLDLIGLPPSPQEVQAFVQDTRPYAFEQWVDRLLASPAYGERWARVWLDLARYADSAGHGSDPLRPNIWPWRDWVIRALNANMPFDRFTLEQMAGDLLPDATPEQQVATAFHRNSMTNTEGGTDDEEWRIFAVKDRANVTAQVWMGLTMACAQCHTHKYDPISHREYYAFTAFFNQTEDNDQPDERPTLPLPTPEEIARFTRLSNDVVRVEVELASLMPVVRGELAAWQSAQSPTNWLVPTMKDGKTNQVKAPEKIIAALTNANRTPAQQQELEKWFRPYAPSTAKLDSQLAALKKERDTFKPVAVPVLRELSPNKQRVTRILNKGNFLDPGDAVQPAVPEAFHPLPPGAPTNRLGLAQWLVSRENPLTARVAVNRLWAQLFGTGLVETEEDFGTQGALPSHPELLDWLAVEFMDRGWDMKAMLKLIITSETYQQSSRLSVETAERDPRNRLLSRYPRRRIEAEAVRDQALALSGMLSRKIGGPSVFPPQPDGLWRAAFNGERTWSTSKGEDRYRRGLYTFWRRTVPYPSMTMFDAPSRESCTVRRLPTNTPLQAFVTLNDPVFVECAQALGRRLVKEGGATIEERVRFGLRLCLSREPDDAQVRALVKLFESERAHYAAHTPDAEKLATDPLGKLPPGLEAAEAAAWTVVANVLLNLDGVLMKG